MPNLFDSVKMTKPGKNSFDLSHDVKMSLRMGTLTPTMLLECVPGDSFNIGCSSLLRFAPLISPVMHRMDVTMHYFFVPNRIVWPNWEEFITDSTIQPGADTPAAFPTVDILADGTNYTPLMDYLGLPTPLPTGTNETVSAIPFAAYQLIYNEYYRDQNLQTQDWGQEYLADGDNTFQIGVLSTLRSRSWEHDYFTSALPFSQKGSVVDIPLGSVKLADEWDVVGAQAATGGNLPSFRLGLPSYTYPFNTVTTEAINNPLGGYPAGTYAGISSNNGGFPMAYDPQGTLEVDATTINDLRRAFRLQEWLEKAARGGSRYIESILAHFGVRSSDRRLNRPEYITGTKSPVVISEVLQTAENGPSPIGTQAGHAVSVTSGKYGNYYCEEHGYIIGIMNVQPKTAYQQGIHRTWLKTDPFDYFWPTFANIGEQEIQNREIFAFQGSTGDNTFGYIPRYSEYKYQANRVAGDFKDNLDFWHMGRIFATPPALNSDFVSADPTERIFAVTDPNIDKLYCQVLHKIRAVRAMPKYGNPTF